MGFITVEGNFAGDSTLVTMFIDTSVKPDLAGEGFVRVTAYSVNRQVGPLRWRSQGPKTLDVSDGGTASGGSCLLGVCSRSPTENFTAVASFYRAPAEAPGPETPFNLPATLRFDGPLVCTHEILKGGPGSEVVYFYPLIGRMDSTGTWRGEPFVNPGNYFYTVCVRVTGTEDFYIGDPEMDIGP
jgi:hypothetical protein